VSTIAVLFALLVASYVGALLLSSPGRAGWLASAVAWILAGLIFGPSGLALVSQPIMEALTPLALVGTGWLALGAGLRLGVAARRMRPGLLAVAALGTLGTAGAVAGVVAAALLAFAPGGALDARERLLVAAAAGLACAQTAQRSPRTAARAQARGGVPELLSGAAAGGDLAIVTGAAVLIDCFGAPAGGEVGWCARAGTELAGLVLGGLAALLLRHGWSQTRALGVLFGTSLLVIGVATGLRLSILGAAFGLGLALSLLSRHAARLRGVAAAAEMPVLIPVLLLAGARLDPRAAPWVWAAAGAAVAAHVVAKALLGHLLVSAFLGARWAGAPVRAAALARSSTLATSFSLVVAVALPGPAGAVALTAAAAALAGDLVAPLVLRTAGGPAREGGAESDAVAAEETAP
jgi:hypothetical protein